MAILRLHHVTKRYGRRTVLAGCSLDVQPGDFILLVGPNGSGKTTLIRMLATLTRPSLGRIEWDPTDGGKAPTPEAVRARLGLVAHHPLAYDELTLVENLLLVLRLHRVRDAASRADETLAAFGLADRSHERTGSLSRGLKQRLALARAFAARPRLLLLDEPGTALDSAAHENLLEQLGAYDQDAAIVLATHLPDPYRPLATRQVELHGGRLVEGGATHP